VERHDRGKTSSKSIFRPNDDDDDAGGSSADMKRTSLSFFVHASSVDACLRLEWRIRSEVIIIETSVPAQMDGEVLELRGTVLHASRERPGWGNVLLDDSSNPSAKYISRQRVVGRSSTTVLLPQTYHETFMIGRGSFFPRQIHSRTGCTCCTFVR
jgi:hypothetical protein